MKTFRRLAYHRSYFLIGFGVVGLALVTLFVLDRSYFRHRWLEGPEYLVPIFGGAFALLCIARGLTGSWSRWQLRVDIPAGLLQLPDGKIVKLAELGEITTTQRNPPYRGRHSSKIHELRVASRDRVLFDSVYAGEVAVRYEALQVAVLQSALRRVLEAPMLDDTAFRAGPALADEIERLAGDSPYRAAALQALTRDVDPTIRARARELVTPA